MYVEYVHDFETHLILPAFFIRLGLRPPLSPPSPPFPTGNIRGLQKEMALALGPPSSEGQPPTPEQIMEKIASAVEQDAVQTIILTFADQRRLILEAVAMGSFLRDAEDYVEKESTSDILTPLPPLPFDDNSIKGLLGDGGQA
mmetsp:Transcript_25824/g.41532  ORF Transcript_25824/g.41532 Transcript_25824/m.41532 type:complete len:143 (+) Transcript_25824:1669-2097(+)